MTPTAEGGQVGRRPAGMSVTAATQPITVSPTVAAQWFQVKAAGPWYD